MAMAVCSALWLLIQIVIYSISPNKSFKSLDNPIYCENVVYCPNCTELVNLSKLHSFIRSYGFFKQRVRLYNNHSACFSLEKIRLVGIHPNPGPTTNDHSIKCLYLNARSIVNKTKEFQTLAVDTDLILVTETWLKPNVLDCELLPGSTFTIYRRDRIGQVGGGVLLAVRNSIRSFRRTDIESNSEMLACELHPDAKKKFLAIVFYRPPVSDLNYIKEFKKALQLASTVKFDRIIICGDFNLPNIDWTTGTATSGEPICNHFTKTVRDNFLCQMVDFPTRANNTLDLILTNFPDKI